MAGLWLKPNLQVEKSRKSKKLGPLVLKVEYVLKISKFRKQIMTLWILTKNEQNALRILS